MLSESFYITLLSTSSTIILALAALAYKSKCSSVKCCCLSLIRDTAGEEVLDGRTIQTTV